jgi:hypothetical protein
MQWIGEPPMKDKVLELASREGRRPTWEMALIYPDQGGWTVAEYLRLDIGRHVEFQKRYGGVPANTS